MIETISEDNRSVLPLKATIRTRHKNKLYDDHSHNICTRSGFTLTEIAIVIGIIGTILAAVWVAADAVYQRQHAKRAFDQTMTIYNGYRSLYRGHVELQGNDIDVTSIGITNGLFPPDMEVFTGPTGSSAPLLSGPWAGSYVRVYSYSAWNAIAVIYQPISESACNNLANAFATGTAAPVGLLNINEIVGGPLSPPSFTAQTISSACSIDLGAGNRFVYIILQF